MLYGFPLYSMVARHDIRGSSSLASDLGNPPSRGEEGDKWRGCRISERTMMLVLVKFLNLRFGTSVSDG